MWRNTCLLQKAEEDLLSQRETMWIGKEHISKETKPHGLSLCWTRFQGGLPGCSFSVAKSLLLEPEFLGNIPKGCGPQEPPLEPLGRNGLLLGSAQSMNQMEVLWEHSEASWSQAPPMQAHLLSRVCPAGEIPPHCPSLCVYLSKDHSTWPSVASIPALNMLSL